MLARLSGSGMKTCCTLIPAADARPSRPLLDSLYVSPPSKPVSRSLSLGLFFGLTRPPPHLG